MHHNNYGVGWLATCLAAGVSGISLDITSEQSLKQASATIAADMMHFYTGNNPGDNPGNLPQPYYWWEAGAMFMHMTEYYYCQLRHTVQQYYGIPD